MSLFFRRVGFRHPPTDTFVPFAFTTIPDPDTVNDRQIYVTSAGSDSTGDGTSSTPYKTFYKATTRWRQGFGDRIILKKGETFSSSGELYGANLGGNSSSRPMMITSYGTGTRPKIDYNGTAGQYFLQNSFHSNISDFWMVGVELTSSGYDGSFDSGGIHPDWVGSGILVEDCYIHNLGLLIYLQGAAVGRLSNCKVRACTIADSYRNVAGNAGNHGSFIFNVDDLLYENCIFIDCGWPTSSTTYASTFKHALYVHAGGTGIDGGGSTNCKVWDNLVIGGDGITCRPGGSLSGNIGVRSMSILQAGMGDAAQISGIQMDMNDNIGLELSSYDPSNIVTIGFGIGNITSSSNFKRNIVANTAINLNTQDCHSLWFRVPDDIHTSGNDIIVQANTIFEDNIFYKAGNWNSQYNSPVSSYSGGGTFRNNAFVVSTNTNEFIRFYLSAIVSSFTWTGNIYYQSGTPNSWFVIAANPGAGNYTVSQWGSSISNDATYSTNNPNYIDPTRNLASYYASIGGTNSHDDFVAQLRLRSKDTWDNKYDVRKIASYIRAGFGR